MITKFITFLFAFIAINSAAQKIDTTAICADLEDPTANRNYVDEDYTDESNVFWKNIRVVVTVHHDSLGDGWMSEEYVEEAIADLNEQFEEYMFTFELVTIQYHDMNDSDVGTAVLNNQMCLPLTSSANNGMAMDWVWDTEYFMNVHTVPDMCGTILGFAWRYPSPYNVADGVWVQANVFGLDEDYCLLNRAENKTLVHEVGHYFGLYHTFHATDNCNTNVFDDCTQIHDRICDTPPTTVNFSCEDPACWSNWDGHPWENYVHNNHMDYYIDSCRTAFTNGQLLYMHNHMVYNRPTIIGDTETCWGDVNDDYVINTDDLLMLLNNYGNYTEEVSCESCDINFDGYVGTQDLMIMLANWGTGCYGAGEGIFNMEVSPTRKINVEQPWRLFRDKIYIQE
jgi:hypothetical protein